MYTLKDLKLKVDDIHSVEKNSRHNYFYIYIIINKLFFNIIIWIRIEYRSSKNKLILTFIIMTL